MPNPAEPAAAGRRRLSRKGRVLVAVAVVAVMVLFLSLRGIAGFYTDYLWFDSLGAASVWRGVLGAKIALGVIFTGVFFALLWINLLIADRLAPRFRPSGPEEELLERYYDLVGRRSGLVRFGAAAMFALIAGVGVSQQWRSWLLFTNRVDFGRTDPLHGLDIGFYVFQLPFLQFLVSWLFAAFVIILIVTLVAHYLNGGIRVQTPSQRVTSAVKGHLSVLLGVLAVIKAADYLLQRYALTLSTRGFVQGAAYSDIRAKLPALNLLMAISVLSVVLFLFNIKRRGWTLPVVAVGLWAFAAVVAGSAYPWFVQRFSVEARGESAKEQPYIERNIAATRDAYALTDVKEETFSADASLDAEQIAAASERGVFRNVGLLDPSIVSEVVNREQSQNGWLAFPGTLDTDRYEVNGQETLTIVGARELNRRGVPQQSWEGLHLIYTQGYGAVVAAAGQVVAGNPAYLVRGVGDRLRVDESVDVALDQPRVYFSETLDGYAIVNNERPEIAFEGDGFTYDGDGGVVLSSVLRRAAFALRFGDLNPLVSGFITSRSRLLHVRDVAERVATVAPFLAFDSDPYPVLADGRMVYVIDGYTTSDSYPYSESYTGGDLPGDSGLRHSFNYVRNSVKATVDAFDGSVTLYLVDDGPDGDPIALAYQRAFPSLFRPLTDMPPGLREHLRHPQDLFRVQTSMFALYHVTDPTEFYSQVGRWAVADQPDQRVENRTVTSLAAPTTSSPLALSGVGQSNASTGQRVDPQYQLLALPDEQDLSFVLTRPFVPISDRQLERRETLTAFMAAKPDGSLSVYRVTTPEVLSPTLLTSRILSDDAISRQISLLANPGTGSEVRLGARVMVPIEQSLLWITPMYVTAAASSSSSVPEFNSVIVSYGTRLVIAPTLTSALTTIFGDQVPFDTLNDTGAPPVGGEVDGGGQAGPSTTTTTGPSTTSTTTATTAPTTEPTGPTGTSGPLTDTEAVAEAARLLADAEAALRAGDLAGYQQRVREAQALLDARVTQNSATTSTTSGQA
ncbi:MAG: UPF0182 family protein [Acidimicrobiales bacterium]